MKRIATDSGFVEKRQRDPRVVSKQVLSYPVCGAVMTDPPLPPSGLRLDPPAEGRPDDHEREPGLRGLQPARRLPQRPGRSHQGRGAEGEPRGSRGEPKGAEGSRGLPSAPFDGVLP